MPEPKKRASPNPGKTAKISVTEPEELVVKVLVNENDETNESIETPQENAVPKVKIKDIMHSEPVLTSLIVKHYEGNLSELGFYHGEGSASFNGGMVYKGAFQNGKMHGQGVCSWSDGTIFSGDFVENVITGKGIYNWPDGSMYEGEVENSLRHGFGIFKCNGCKSYIGQWKHGKRHGKGIIYYNSTEESYYDGEWYENEKRGHGIRKFKNGNMYEGQWYNNIRHGKGRMYWYTVGQEYFGNWQNGSQNGHGENIWYLKRVDNSQYPLRNHYIGDFLNGERHGQGKFHYASGAIYDGEWKYNMKHGHGKFTFKNGCVFSGAFEDDHMVEYPELILSGMTTPDISKIGLPVESALSFQADNTPGNSADAFLDIDIGDILHGYEYDLEQREEEKNNIIRIILRFTTQMKCLYKLYSCIGMDISIDNTFVMTKLQFLRFLKDYNLHTYDHSVVEIERYLLIKEVGVEDCFQQIFIRDFLTHLVKLSVFLFSTDYEKNDVLVSSCFSKLVDNITNKDDINIQGSLFQSSDQFQEMVQYSEECLNAYFYFNSTASSKDTLTMRDFLLLFKEMNLLNHSLTSTAFVEILTKEDKLDGYFNLDREVSMLEFLEVLISSSTVFVTSQMIQQHLVIEQNQSEVLPVFEVSPTKSTSNTIEELHEIESEIFETEKEDKVSAEPVGVETYCSKASEMSPSKSSGSNNQKPSKSNKKIRSESKKIEKENSIVTLHSKSKEKKDNRTEKKGSNIKTEDSKSKSPASGIDQSGELSASDVSKLQPKSSDKNPADDIPVESSKNDELLNNDLGINQGVAENSTQTISDGPLLFDASTDNAISSKDTVDDFETWSLKLSLFFNSYFFPAYRKRKEVHSSIEIMRE